MDSVEFTVTGAYYQAKSKLRMEGDAPDAEQVQDQLNDDLSTKDGMSASDREMFDEMSNEEIARAIPMLRHRDRRILLKDDEFIRKEWAGVRETIGDDETLQGMYGEDGTQHVKPGQGKNICAHHDAPLDKDRYMDVTISNGMSVTRDESGELKLRPIGQADIGAGATEGRTATAGRTEIRQRIVKVCAEDQDNCPVSLKEFVREADNRLSNLQSRKDTSKMREQLEEHWNKISSDNAEITSDPAESVETQPSQSPPQSSNATVEEQERIEDNTSSRSEQVETAPNDNVEEETTTQAETEQTVDKDQQLLDQFISTDDQSSSTATTSNSESTDAAAHNESVTTNTNATPEQSTDEAMTNEDQDEKTTEQEGEKENRGERLANQYSSTGTNSPNNNHNKNSNNGKSL